MAKVLAIFMIELRPGVEEEDFETFISEEVPKLPKLDGVKSYFLKADRGPREGKYLQITEFPSVESRDRFWPSLDVPSEECRQWRESFSEKQNKIAHDFDQKYADVSHSTDYIVFAQPW